MSSFVGPRRRSQQTQWIHVATFERHNGNQDAAGQPTYSVERDWITEVPRWPCSLRAVRGGEVIRGGQVAATTTHVLFGEYYGALGVTQQMRCFVNDKLFHVVAVEDKYGLNNELRIELRESDSA